MIVICGGYLWTTGCNCLFLYDSSGGWRDLRHGDRLRFDNFCWDKFSFDEWRGIGGGCRCGRWGCYCRCCCCGHRWLLDNGWRRCGWLCVHRTRCKTGRIVWRCGDRGRWFRLHNRIILGFQRSFLLFLQFHLSLTLFSCRIAQWLFGDVQ